MTLIIALVWGSGVLVSADSRASTGYVIHEEKKIYPIYVINGKDEYDLAILAGAGDAALVKQGFLIIEKEFHRWFSGLQNQKRNPTQEEIEELVSHIEHMLTSRYSRLWKIGLKTDVSLLLAAVTSEGSPVLYVFDERGIAEPRHNFPGYALLGRGEVTGGLMLFRLLNYTKEISESWDLGLLSSFIIDMVSEVDPTVSPFLGESYYIRYQNGKVVLGPLKNEALKEYKGKIELRKKIFNLIWTAAEKVGEIDILNSLNEMLAKEE